MEIRNVRNKGYPKLCWHICGNWKLSVVKNVIPAVSEMLAFFIFSISKASFEDHSFNDGGFGKGQMFPLIRLTFVERRAACDPPGLSDEVSWGLYRPSHPSRL